ncbi:toll/interleukin-1 receptor domain-containing protein [Sinorhizobium saheli]|uniref:tRNA-ribosyltransferase n=1 Tax=Sinorhizobium saheli TaxID=36856 RepID=A0A178Y6Z8_SINSA|nr:toll/interleukin-1 receptor domain-containing protein [Sinorhizobium saheli]MQW87782.1 TIR domain-containing protein [Sinorhizobium saheli]OAP43114.1 tRNA-ribosyltransferase [Sinorhizobium saheli]
MADVYVIHSSEDNDKTSVIVELLEEHWDVWWDDQLVGNFAFEIEKELPQSKCAVVVWSSDACKSALVRDEVRIADELGIPIIPVRLDGSSLPYPYGGLSTVNFTAWDGANTHAAFRQLVRKIATKVARRVPPVRPQTAPSLRLSLPTVFLSVSSHETQLVPLEAVKALRVFGAPTILISAYDLLPGRRPKGIIAELRQIRRNGGFVLVDSGNYEATRREDSSWTPDLFVEAMKGIPHDWAYCFDVMKPSLKPDVAVREIVAALERDRAASKHVLPIVHAPRKRLSGYDVQSLPYVVKEVASQTSAPLVAVAERELGSGIIERAKTVQRIRQELDKLPSYLPLHILGTGNPWSIAILTAAGADSFDGLEWCRMVIDRDTHRLNHYQHFDFFAFQASLADSPVTVSALSDDKVAYAGRVAFHNLDYYREFAADLAQAAHERRMEAFLVGMMGRASTKQIREAVPGLFA